MSLLGSISHGFESVAESITSSFESAPEVLRSRTYELTKAMADASKIHVIEVPTTPVVQRLPEQAPTFPLNTVDFVPTPAESETLAPIVFTDETFTSAIPTDPQIGAGLDANEIRATLDTIRYAQMDTQALAEMANRSQI